jgi:hypothetical protein
VVVSCGACGGCCSSRALPDGGTTFVGAAPVVTAIDVVPRVLATIVAGSYFFFRGFLCAALRAIRSSLKWQAARRAARSWFCSERCVSGVTTSVWTGSGVCVVWVTADGRALVRWCVCRLRGWCWSSSRHGVLVLCRREYRRCSPRTFRLRCRLQNPANLAVIARLRLS